MGREEHDFDTTSLESSFTVSISVVGYAFTTFAGRQQYAPGTRTE